MSGQTVQLDLSDACTVRQVRMRLTLMRLPIITATKRRTDEQHCKTHNLIRNLTNRNQTTVSDSNKILSFVRLSSALGQSAQTLQHSKVGI